MKPRAASISIRKIFVDELVFKRNAEFSDKLQNVIFPFEFKKDTAYVKDSNHIICRIIARVEDKEGEKPLPFTFKVTMAGEFQVNDPNKTDIEILREISCPSILFPYLRETISTITTKAGYPPLFIPTLNFAGDVECKDETPEQKKNSEK